MNPINEKNRRVNILLEMMPLEQKIDELNEYTHGSLSLTHYVKWQLNSYADNSLFTPYNSEWHKQYEADTFREIVDRAYLFMVKDYVRKI